MLAQAMPKSIIRSLDTGAVLLEALIAQGHAAPFGPVIALSSIQSYWNAARREHSRVARAKAAVWRPGSPSQSNLFQSVHFYLIAWSRISKLARFIHSATHYKTTKLVLNAHRVQMDARIDARDHLEHLEERLPGGPKHKTMKVPNDLLNMRNDRFTFGGCEVDVGPASLQLLRKIVQQFDEAVLRGSMEALARRDPDRLSALVNRAASEVSIRRTTARVTKELIRLGMLPAPQRSRRRNDQPPAHADRRSTRS